MPRLVSWISIQICDVYSSLAATFTRMQNCCFSRQSAAENRRQAFRFPILASQLTGSEIVLVCRGASSTDCLLQVQSVASSLACRACMQQLTRSNGRHWPSGLSRRHCLPFLHFRYSLSPESLYVRTDGRTNAFELIAF
jgi:hypothetical protein